MGYIKPLTPKEVHPPDDEVPDALIKKINKHLLGANQHGSGLALSHKEWEYVEAIKKLFRVYGWSSTSWPGIQTDGPDTGGFIQFTAK